MSLGKKMLLCILGWQNKIDIDGADLHLAIQDGVPLSTKSGHLR